MHLTRFAESNQSSEIPMKVNYIMMKGVVRSDIVNWSEIQQPVVDAHAFESSFKLSNHLIETVIDKTVAHQFTGMRRTLLQFTRLHEAPLNFCS